jgi:hypothetical protein
VIGNPRILNLLAAPRVEENPEFLQDLLLDVWTEDRDEGWSGQEIALFSDPPQPNNCFYVVFDEDQPINGNVIALKGPMGVGKTAFAKNGVAKVLQRPFEFFSLGGASD